MADSLIDRFESMIERIPESGCWIWVGGMRNEHYGSFWHNGRTVLAHQFSVELHTGKAIKDDAVVDHKCCVKACVNPEHLEVVSQSENIKRHYRRNCDGQ